MENREGFTDAEKKSVLLSVETSNGLICIYSIFMDVCVCVCV